MNEHKKPSIGFWTTLFGVGTLVLYVGTYAALVSPVKLPRYKVVAACRSPLSGRIVQSPFCEVAFGPLIHVDRKLRPEKWRPIHFDVTARPIIRTLD